MRTLTNDKQTQFFRIHKNLVLFTNKRYSICERFKTTDDLQHLLEPHHREDFLAIHDKLYSDETLDAFCKENPYQLTHDDLVIADTWRHYYSTEGYIYRHLANYTVILFQRDDTRLYGIKSLTDDLEHFCPNEYLPVMVKITLLPFGEDLVYDSFLQPYNIQFGGGIKRNLRDDYNRAKGNYGIYTQYHPGDDLADPPSTTSLKEQINYGIKEASKRNVFPSRLLRHAESEGERALFELAYAKEYVRDTKKWLKSNNDIPSMYYGLYRECIIAVMPTRKGVVEFCETHYPDICEYISIFKG